MLFKDVKLLFIIPVLSILIYFGHQLIFAHLNIDETSFYYQLSTLYSVFAILAIFIVGILIFIKTKNLDIVGMSFLILTTSKMILCYILVRPILNMTPTEMSIQKMNFFGIFILFLAIETIITIRILNNK